MKKYIGIIWINLILSSTVMADITIPWTKTGCESVKGKWITAHATTDTGCDANHCNGKNFCSSGVPMNWWSSLIFCQSIGHKMVSWDNLCPGTIYKVGANCANIKGVDGNGAAWTDIPVTNSTVQCALLKTGEIRECNRTNPSGGGYALCEE
ncbi:MAG: hypothetical protein J6Y85_05465 [Alphaproteobacteria bacterium]|nr:hypothetical protein [Alphaproteobacteria bacterium]